MAEDAALEKLKAKIRQLRAVAACSGATEGEVMNAIAIAERLKREHGIDEDAIAVTRLALRIPLGRLKIQPIDGLQNVIGWFAECECWVTHGGGEPAVVTYYGDEPDALIAEYLHAVCYGAVARATAEFKNSTEYRRRRLTRTRRAAILAFTLVMISQLRDRLYAMKAGEKDRIELKRAALARALTERGMQFNKGKTPKPAKLSGYESAGAAGFQAGNAVPISPGIGEAPSNRYLPAPGRV